MINIKEIIEAIDKGEGLSPQKVCEYIEIIDIELMNEAINASMAYSLIYSLCEWLALYMQQNNLLGATNADQ